MREDAGVVPGFAQLLLRLQDRLVFVQELIGVERLVVARLYAPQADSFNTRFGRRIYAGENYAIAFAPLLVRELR